METQISAAEVANSDMEIMKKMEDEHLRLQRHVRMIQTDRQERTMGVHPQFRVFDQQMRTLKKEYINLYKDLKIARSGAHKKKDKKMNYDLKNTLKIRVASELECEDGLTVMQQMDDLLQRNNKNLLHLRKLYNATAGQIKERRIQSENRLLSTENELETANGRYDVIQFENKKIREEIEHMLKDRALFNQSWTKMIGVLTKGKKFLTDLFESSTLAYDQRDEWCSNLRSVQEKGKMDQMLQLQEMRDLQKAFDHEMKLYNFLLRKGVIRINKKQEKREEMAKKKIEEDFKKRTQEHVKILNEITDYAEEDKIDNIIETFVRKEQENFSMYELLAEYSAENEFLSKSLTKSQQDIYDRRDWNEMKESKRQEKIQLLTKTLEEQTEKKEEIARKLEEKLTLLNVTMEKIGDIFRMMDCSLEPFENLLGDKQPSLLQMDLTLRLITEKIKENVELVCYYERHYHTKTDKSTSRLKKYTIHTEPPQCWKPTPISLVVTCDPCPNCVEARWLSRVSEAHEVPLPHDMVLSAISELNADPAYVRSDRIHLLIDCKVPRSRVILATRYMNQ